MRQAPTIGQWLGADGLGNYNEEQVQILWFDVQQVLSGHFEHRFRVFVKDEPHKRSKIEASKWRLIMASALPVQMVWRMCFSHQNDWLNQRPFQIPSAHGLVFCYGGWRKFKAHARTQDLRYSRDLSAWDVGAPGWVFDVIQSFRTGYTQDLTWLSVVQWLYDDAYRRSTLAFSNGVVIQQQYEGTMKSGLFVTISDNSIAMVALHTLASFRSRTIPGNIWATGDDVLQQYYSVAYEESLAQLGGYVKEVEESLSFMGTNFNFEPEPAYFHKHLVNLSCKPLADWPEVLDGYCRLYAYSSKLDCWMQLAQQNSISLRDPRYYKFWYGSPLASYLKWFS